MCTTGRREHGRCKVLRLREVLRPGERKATVLLNGGNTFRRVELERGRAGEKAIPGFHTRCHSVGIPRVTLTENVPLLRVH